MPYTLEEIISQFGQKTYTQKEGIIQLPTYCGGCKNDDFVEVRRLPCGCIRVFCEDYVLPGDVIMLSWNLSVAQVPSQVAWDYLSEKGRALEFSENIENDHLWELTGGRVNGMFIIDE